MLGAIEWVGDVVGVEVNDTRGGEAHYTWMRGSSRAAGDDGWVGVRW